MHSCKYGSSRGIHGLHDTHYNVAYNLVSGGITSLVPCYVARLSPEKEGLIWYTTAHFRFVSMTPTAGCVPPASSCLMMKLVPGSRPACAMVVASVHTLAYIMSRSQSSSSFAGSAFSLRHLVPFRVKSYLLESSHYIKHRPKMMQCGSFLFLAVFLGLVCIGSATPLNVTAYQLRLSLLSESCRISDDDAQRFYKQRRQNDTRYNGFSGDEQLPSKSLINVQMVQILCNVMKLPNQRKKWASSLSAYILYSRGLSVQHKFVLRSPTSLKEWSSLRLLMHVHHASPAPLAGDAW